MKRLFVVLVLGLLPVSAYATDDVANDATPPTTDHAALIQAVTNKHILPRYEALAETGATLAETATQHCSGTGPALRAAWGKAFDAWIGVSHLRFGPSETDNRAFSLAFWPDSRGKTPKAQRGLILKGDDTLLMPAAFAVQSIAVQGYYAMEYLLYDPEFATLGAEGFRCDLVKAMAGNIALVTAAIRDDWVNGYAQTLITAGAEGNARYQTQAEGVQELFKALGTGLQVTSDMRLQRPLGTLDRPRPARAEARLSGRSVRHVILSVEALDELAGLLSTGAPSLAGQFHDGFGYVREAALALDDPTFATVSDPGKRLNIETLQAVLEDLREIAAIELGAHLGVVAGFNALDGD
ncbi:MAG: imelysin family protein [Rhodobacteraceae bacterium]|nr:imelysin family protein [Paracoccaceae bacterium]